MSTILLNTPTRRWLPWVIAAGLGLAAGIYLLETADTANTKATAAQTNSAGATANQHTGASSTYAPQLPGSEQLTNTPDSTRSPLDTVKPPNFRVDAKGNLVMDEAFRIDLERVYGLHQGPGVLRKLDEFSEHLPEKAKEALREQYKRYVQYDAAVMLNLSSLRNAEEISLENAQQELEILHDLRQTYFGPEGAKAMFAQEEAQSQELHDYIRDHTDPNLPMLQRVELAQAAWLKARETPVTPSQTSP